MGGDSRRSSVKSCKSTSKILFSPRYQLVTSALHTANLELSLPGVTPLRSARGLPPQAEAAASAAEREREAEKRRRAAERLRREEQVAAHLAELVRVSGRDDLILTYNLLFVKGGRQS